jgi:hypothetical protein
MPRNFLIQADQGGKDCFINVLCSVAQYMQPTQSISHSDTLTKTSRGGSQALCYSNQSIRKLQCATPVWSTLDRTMTPIIPTLDIYALEIPSLDPDRATWYPSFIDQNSNFQ